MGKTTELDRENLDARVKLGNYYIAAAKGHPELVTEAERLAKEILQNNYNHVEGHILMGSVLYAQNEREKAFAEMSGLREQQKAYIAEVGRLQDRRSPLASQLALVKKSSEQAKEDIAENTTDPKTTLAWSQLVSRKADLESQLTRMLTELRPKHPDVLAKQAEVDSVKEAMDQMILEWKQRIKEKQDKLRDRPDLTVGNLESELQLVDGEITRQQNMLGEIDKQIAQVMERIKQCSRR